MNLELSLYGGRTNSTTLLEEFSSDPHLMRRTQELAVDLECLQVQNGKGRHAKMVLNGLDLTVPKGRIYGLLGPSGSGKTTLLRCILGRKKPKEGLIRVLGQTPGRPEACIPGPGVGYMPQELTLYPELEIQETLQFFGKMFDMPDTLIRERIKELIDLLELQDGTRRVGSLSGGQQRRVSLACALIHSPPLLILDEPTVGLDPLLIKKIWDHLVMLTREQGVTVLVTTHHMEEVRVADIVGFMISGRMLAQGSPDRLLENFKCDTLMKVFQELCLADREGRAPIEREEAIALKDEQNNIIAKIVEEPTDGLRILSQDARVYGPGIKGTMPPEPRARGFELKGNRGGSSGGRIGALIKKDLITTGRNVPLLLFALLTPMLHVLLFGNSIGGDPFGLPVAVVNHDVHPILSIPLLESIPPRKIIQRPYSHLDQALKSLQAGETWGVIYLGHNFSTALQYRFLLGIDTDNRTIQESEIQVYIDSTNQQIKFELQKTIFETLITFYEKLLSKNNKHTALAKLPIQIKDPFYGDNDLNATVFMTPGIILSITFFMAMALTAVSTTREAREGTMERCLVAGVQSREVIYSHLLSQICVMLLQMSLMLLVVFLVFKIPLEGSFILVVAMTFLQGLAGMTYGLAISAVCTQEQTAIFMALATFIGNLLISGIIWTIQSMPQFLRRVAFILPQTIPVESLRCIMYRGWGLERYEVILGFLISVAWPCFFLFFAFRFFKSQRG